MPQSKRSGPKAAETLTKTAASLPGVSTGIACAGTALESKTFTVAKKAFLFVGPKDARLKLGSSLDEANQLAKRMPASVRVGSNGWVTIRVDEVGEVDASTLGRWVKESHQLYDTASASKSANKKPRSKASKKSSRA